MKSCTISFRIKDYFPKIDTIPFEEYVCLFINGEFNEKIPLIEKDYNICKHQINNVNSDLKYKIHLVNINDFSLVGICDIVIPYAIISQFEISGSFIKEQQLKLFTDMKTKRKLFGTIVSSGDIYLYISAEVLVDNSQLSTEKKKRNSIINKTTVKKDYNNTNNNFGNNKKYRIIKTDKDSLRNECKTYSCLKNIQNSNTINPVINEFKFAPLTQDRKEKQINKHQSNPLKIDFKNNNLTIDNNLKNVKKQNQKVKKVQTHRKKITILDLMEQKIQNKKELKELNNDTNINNNKKLIKKNNNSPKDFKNIIIENKENISLNHQNNYFFINKTKNTYDNIDNISKEILSPVNNEKNLLLKDKINYIYKKKSAQKIKTKISDNNIAKINSPSSYNIPNFNLNDERGDKNNKYVKKNKSCSSSKIPIQIENKTNFDNNDNNINNNITNITNENTFNTLYEMKNKITELDKIIEEKRNFIKIEFQNQLYNSTSKNKNLLEHTYDQVYINLNNNSNRKILDELSNIKYNRSQKDFLKKNKNLKFNTSNSKTDLDSSKTINNNMTPCSSKQKIMNIIITQEDLKNNILNLLDFYSLIKKKINLLKENSEKIHQKLIIKKEKFNHQLKKNNRLTQKIISVESKIIYHANINCLLNEQIILPIVKIKKLESYIFQIIFGVSCYNYDIIKFREREKNKLFDEQNIMHLLLIILKNMVEHYGNITSRVFQDDLHKKKILKVLLLKYEIEERKETNSQMNKNLNINNHNYNNYNNSQFLSGQIMDEEFLNKFKIIREVEEDKEYDDSEEEERIKKENKNKYENIIESIIVDVNENNNNDTNEKEIENGAIIKIENENGNNIYEEYNSKKNISINDINKNEKINGIETSIETDKSDNLKEKNKSEKSKSIISLKTEKRNISIEDEEKKYIYEEDDKKIKNGADSSEKQKENISSKDEKKETIESSNFEIKSE